MNSRDFYLLVRSYFQEKSKILHAPMDIAEKALERRNKLEKEILKELEEFTKRDVEELPF